MDDPRATADLVAALSRTVKALPRARAGMSATESPLVAQRNSWYPAAAHQPPLRRTQFPYTWATALGEFFPISEEQFRVLLLTPEGGLRRYEVIAAGTLCVWTGIRAPEDVTDEWMEAWQLPVATESIDQMRRWWSPLPLRTHVRADVLAAVCRTHRVDHTLIAAYLFSNYTMFHGFPEELAHEMVTKIRGKIAEHTRALHRDLGVMTHGYDAAEPWPVIWGLRYA